MYTAWGAEVQADPYEDVKTGFLTAMVEAVDPERWTANIYIEGTGQRQIDVPMMSPYFHWEKGQGAYFIPEEGAKCIVAQANDTYFILGFIPVVDKGFSDADSDLKPTQNLSKEFTSEARSALKQPPGEKDDRTLSYRCNREGDMLKGDYCLKTRAFNKFKLFTNGNILMEATKLCFTVWSHLKDWIMTVCVNSLLKTPGGEIRWTNDDATRESDYKREIKRLVDDKFTSFIELIGHDSETYIRMVTDRNTRENISQTEFYPEHFREHIRETGDWDRRVSHDGKNDTDAYIEHVNPDGNWDKKITRSGTSSMYHKNIDAAGNVVEDAAGSETIDVHGNKTESVHGGSYIMQSPGGIIHLNP